MLGLPAALGEPSCCDFRLPVEPGLPDRTRLTDFPLRVRRMDFPEGL